jgi:hypothetical protein
LLRFKFHDFIIEQKDILFIKKMNLYFHEEFGIEVIAVIARREIGIGFG